MTTFYNLVAQLLKVLLAFEPNVTTVEAITRSNRLSKIAYSVAAAASSSKASDFSCFSIFDDPFGIFHASYQSRTILSGSSKKSLEFVFFLAIFFIPGNISGVGRVRSPGSLAIRSRFSGGGGDRECPGHV